MAYSEGKRNSAAYIGFFDVDEKDRPLTISSALDIERLLGKNEQHLRHMPQTPANLSKEAEIHQARNDIRSAVGIVLLPPLERQTKASDTPEASTDYVRTPGSV